MAIVCGFGRLRKKPLANLGGNMQLIKEKAKRTIYYIVWLMGYGIKTQGNIYYKTEDFHNT